MKLWRNKSGSSDSGGLLGPAGPRCDQPLFATGEADIVFQLNVKAPSVDAQVQEGAEASLGVCGNFDFNRRCRMVKDLFGIHIKLYGKGFKKCQAIQLSSIAIAKCFVTADSATSLSS